MGLVTTARAAPASASTTARSIDRVMSGAAARSGRPATISPGPRIGSTGSESGKCLGPWSISVSIASGISSPSARARTASTAGSPIRTKGGICSRRRAAKAPSAISGPIPAGSPIVSASGRSTRSMLAMGLRLARNAPLAVLDERLRTDIAQQSLGAKPHFLAHQLTLRLLAGGAIAGSGVLAAHCVKLDGGLGNRRGRHLPHLGIRNEQPGGLGQRRRFIVLERVYVRALDAVGKVGAGLEPRAHGLGGRELAGDDPLVGARGKGVFDLAELQGRFRRRCWPLAFGGGGASRGVCCRHRLVHVHLGDLDVAAELFLHRRLPHQLRADAILQ